MSDFAMTIAGKSTGVGGPTFDVENPATEALVGKAPDCTNANLEAAMEGARSAFAAWAEHDDARRCAMTEAARLLLGSVEELADILTLEQGKPLAEARYEVTESARRFEYHAKMELPSEVLRSDDRCYVEVAHRPLGVVAAITPWNFPILMAVIKLAPALRAGNTVVLKPSPHTPLSSLMMGRVISDAFPPGVLNIITGTDALGALMTKHNAVAKVTFTGSIASGKKVAVSAAQGLRKVTLELGGNDPAIVLSDADPGTIARDIFWAAFANNGQICIAIKRLYIHESIHDDVVEALSELARSVRVGEGHTKGIQLGPINNAPQFHRVGNLVKDAISNGAVAAAGGGPLDRPGYFFAPTILTGVTDGIAIVDEEQFGPVLPVMPYRDLDDVIARANASHFGLGASVWSSDSDRAWSVLPKLESGSAWINSHGVVPAWQPYTGAKWSGIGIENGIAGTLAFTQPQICRRPKP
jgi:acyl-CoA reductase-like NAD-dependent aldehyde dehydrogenase